MFQKDDFEPSSFEGLSTEERIGKCHAMAADAERRAAANRDARAEYLVLAEKWYELAEEMQGAQRWPMAAKG